MQAANSNDSSDQYFILLNKATLISRDKTSCFYQCCPMMKKRSCMFLHSGSLHVQCFHYANVLIKNMCGVIMFVSKHTWD